MLQRQWANLILRPGLDVYLIDHVVVSWLEGDDETMGNKWLTGSKEVLAPPRGSVLDHLLQMNVQANPFSQNSAMGKLCSFYSITHELEHPPGSA